MNKEQNVFKDRFNEIVGADATQEEIAQKIGTSRQNVGNWLSGRSKPDILALKNIAQAYDVSTDYLLGISDVKTSDAEKKLFVNTLTWQMRECNEYEISISKLLNVIHRGTELIKIRVIADAAMFEDKMHEFYLTSNFSESREEIDRVLKYYSDVPVWNIHVDFENTLNYPKKGRGVMAAIVANCHYSDIREGLLREKEDIRKEKRREYRQRRKNNA